MNCTPSLAIACLLSFSLFAQDKPDESESKEGKGGKGGIQAVDVEAVEGKTDKEAGDGKGGKEGFTLAKPPRVLEARGQCRFDGAIVQKRLMPGQTGTLKLTMIFEGDAVMTSPAAFRMQALPGGATLANWALQPPTQARVATAFLGQAVYDNWALVEAQVAMPQDARLGEKRSLVLDVEFDLHHGTTGQPLGHFRETVAVPCEVGLPLAAPAVLRPNGNPAGQGSGDGKVAGSTPPTTGQESGEVVVESAKEAHVADDLTDRQAPPVEPASSESVVAAPDSAPEVDQDEGGSWLLGGGVAVALLAVVLVLQRRRQG